MAKPTEWVRVLKPQAVRLGTLQQQLAEFIRKYDYRFRHEQWGSEAGSWLEAARFLTGEPEALR